MKNISKFFNSINSPIVRVLYASIFCYFVIDKYIYESLFVTKNRDYIFKSLIIFYPIYGIMILSTAFFIIFYHIGNQIKKFCGFRFITTGILGFFAVTFLLNLMLCLFKASSVKTELLCFFTFTAFILSTSIAEEKNHKAKIVLLVTLILSFLTISIGSELITVNRFPFSLKPASDEINFWYPMTLRYFDKGLLYAIKNNISPGYGLFTHHVWITIKRLMFLNPDSSFYIPPKLLFLLGLGFIVELNLQKGMLVFVLLFYTLSVHTDAWLRFLLMNGLYGEGVAALFFAVLLKEVLENSDDPISRTATLDTYRICIFWTIAGVLHITKPFVSYLCFMLPFFYKASFDMMPKIKWFKGVLLRLMPMFTFPVLWIIINKTTNNPISYYGVSSFSKVNFSVIFPIINHWSLHMMPMKYYIFSITGAIIGITSINRYKIFSSLFFVSINLCMIIALYATIWVNVEKESAFRYLSETYYLFLYSFALGLPKIYEDTYFYGKTISRKIETSWYKLIILIKSKENVFSIFKGQYYQILTLIGIIIFTLFAIIIYNNKKDVQYIGFYDREKWPDRVYYTRWTGSEAIIKFKKGGPIELNFTCSHPDVEIQPVNLSVNLGSTAIDRITFIKKGVVSRRYYIPDPSNKPIALHFNISRTWNPHEMGISSDKRNLGIAVSEIKFIK